MRGAFRAAVALAIVAVATVAVLCPAHGVAQTVGLTDRPPPTTQPTRVSGAFPATPDGYEISARQALLAADLDEHVRQRKSELGRQARELTASFKSEPGPVWEVGYYRGDEKVNLVIVDGTTGEVKESWTGAAVAWPMARGRTGQFGHLLNAPWVWIPLAAVFLLGLWDFRRWRKWVHLDLLVLLSFGISQIYFNEAEIGISVPLAYPPLLYLLARMLWIGFRGGGREAAWRPSSEGLRPSVPTWLATTLVIGLIVLRVVANGSDSGVIDVGYAGVIGADRITNAQPIYDDSFPEENSHGDTYGPANYFAYVPFELALPWGGAWDDLPAAHAAAIFFDLVTIAGLFVLGLLAGRRARPPRGDPESSIGRGIRAWPARLGTSLASPGGRLGVLLAFAWVAYPYTAFVTQSNSNDGLLGALLVWSLVAFASPPARGILLAAASLTKFAPLALVPLYATGERGFGFRRFSARGMVKPLLLFTLGFAGFAALLLAYPAVDPGLGQFYERTVGSQLDRESPFSVWGQTDLEWLQTTLKGAVLILGVALAFVPRRRSLVQIAALSAALLIGVELTLEHWFYLYIPWFFGALMFALFKPPSAPPGGSGDRSRPPAAAL